MLTTLESVAYKAGETLLRHFNRHLKAQHKANHQSLVSEADFASQAIIQSELEKHFQEAGINSNTVSFLGEEGLDSHGSSSVVIITDPLDGTSNFLSHNPYFAVSIAYLENGEVKYGVTYCPMRKTLYKAELGKGAWKVHNNTEEKLMVQNVPLEECNLNTYFTSNTPIRHEMFKVTEAIFPYVRGMRIWGSGTLELAQFAENRTNIVIYGKCGIWDVAVAQLLIKESGGSLTDWQGQPLILNVQNHDATYRVLACHPNHLETLTKQISIALTQ